MWILVEWDKGAHQHPLYTWYAFNEFNYKCDLSDSFIHGYYLLNEPIDHNVSYLCYNSRILLRSHWFDYIPPFLVNLKFNDNTISIFSHEFKLLVFVSYSIDYLTFLYLYLIALILWHFWYNECTRTLHCGLSISFLHII